MNLEKPERSLWLQEARLDRAKPERAESCLLVKGQGLGQGAKGGWTAGVSLPSSHEKSARAADSFAGVVA